MFTGWELEPGDSGEPPPQLEAFVDREDPQLVDPRYDPLSDHLDEPFPEERLR